MLNSFVLRGLLAVPWSLMSIVRKDMREWQSFNSYRQKLALSAVERQLLFAGEHPIRFAVSLVLLFLGCVWFANVIPPDWYQGDWIAWTASEQLTYFSSLWSVQATIAAVVYPIVISFVTVFLQRRPAAEAFIHLYLLDSVAVASGLSCLALVLVMAAEYVLLPTYGAAALLRWVALDSVWFLLNASLTSYFLFRTIEYLRPDVQLRVVRRYTANVALPREVMRLSLYQVLFQAQSHGWLNIPASKNSVRSEAPSVDFSRYVSRDAESQGIYRLNGAVRLSNVRLWPLRLVVIAWLRSAQKYQGTAPTRAPTRRADRNWPELTIALAPGTEYREAFPIAWVVNGPALTAFQRFLLKRAFVFSPIETERSGILVSAVLDELESDARTTAESSDGEAFEKAYSSLVSMHLLLLGASQAKDEDGLIGSWALLPDNNGLFSRPLHVRWSNAYRSVFQAAIGAIEVDGRPVQRLCHLVQHLDGEEVSMSPLEVRDHLLHMSPLLMHLLGGWWVQKVEEQGLMEHGPHQMVVLRFPLHRKYEDVLSSFVSGWENARTGIAEIPEAESENFWLLAPNVASLNATHILETARMLLEAVSRGDRVAAEWLADVLSKWWGDLEYGREPFELYGKTDFLTLEHVSLEWPVLTETIGLDGADLNPEGQNIGNIQHGVLLAAIKNFWTDIRLLVLEILLYWSAQDNSASLDDSLAMELVVGFLNGKQWKSGGALTESFVSLTASGYLSAKIRQYAADGEWRGGYVGRLNRFVEQIKDMDRPNMVSSRVYSFSGADDIASLTEQQLVLSAAFSGADWGLSKALRRQVEIWMASKYPCIQIIRNRADEWLEHLNTSTGLSPKVLHALLARTEKTHDASLGQARTKHGIEALKDFVEEKRADALAAEEIDANRLLQIAAFASAKGFKPSTGEFPLQLFNAVSLSNEEQIDFTLTSNNTRKGELTSVEMDQHASNEGSFWADAMSQQVGLVLLRDVLSAVPKRDVIAPNAQDYWQALKVEAARVVAFGGTPILILDNPTRPEWVWQWQHSDYSSDYARPGDLQVQRLDGKGDRYICNFNDIEVYSAPIPIGHSILISKECFQTVTFREFDANRYVDVSWRERADSKLLGDLRLTFSRRVKTRNDEYVQLHYETKEP